MIPYRLSSKYLPDRGFDETLEIPYSGYDGRYTAHFRHAHRLSRNESQSHSVTIDMERKEVYKVEGMSCGGCSNSVETALSQASGVKYARVSHQDGTAEIHHTLTEQEIADIITGAGYTVSGKMSD